VSSILIATGSHSHLPTAEEVPGIEHVVTSDDFFEVKQLPKHAVLVGGGYIATEFACIWNGTGQCKVVQVVRHELLSNFDVDLRTDLEGIMVLLPLVTACP
jgi:glutathione reductase (NADPH)